MQTLSKTYWKDVEGHAFYSVTVSGSKFEKRAGCAFEGQVAIYQGPMKAVVDEEGHFFGRGEPVEVCTDTAAKLRQGVWARSFVVIDNRADPKARGFEECGPDCC